MTDQAIKDVSTQHGAPFQRPRDASPPHRDKIVSFSSPSGAFGSPSSAGAEPAPDRRPPSHVGDWSAAIELVHEASEAIRISEERAAELEAQLGQVMAQAAEEMRRLNAEIAGVEQRLARSEDRARAAEDRADEAEAWLGRLHEAVFTAFAPLHRRAVGGRDS